MTQAPETGPFHDGTHAFADVLQAGARVSPGRVPSTLLTLSGGAFLVPLVALAVQPEWMEGDGALLVWLPVLLPAFLLAYFNGWRGASQALAGGMAALSLGQAELLLLDLAPPRWGLLFTLVTLMVGVALGAGWMSHGLHQELDEADQRALTDPLTGLANRRLAWDMLAREWAAAQRGRPVTVVMFDLDEFKRVNDEWGHAEGDKVLVTFARILGARTRASNLSARVGGEEWLSILSDTGLEGGVAFAESLRKEWEGTDLGWGRMTVSAGVATVETDTQSPASLLAAADRALYAAKRQGRNRVCRAPSSPESLPPA